MEWDLVMCLRASWVGMTFVIIGMLLSSRFTQLLLNIISNRGKTTSSTRFTVPQKFFLHFYALAVAWTTILLVTTWFYAYKVAPLICDPSQFSNFLGHSTGGSNAFPLHRSHSTNEEDGYEVWRSVFLLLLMEIQALRRLYETLFVFKYSPSARMHIVGYLGGFFFYTAAPLSLCCTNAIDAFKLVAGLFVGGNDEMTTQISWSEFSWCGILSPLSKWYSWFGTAIFFYGWFHQLKCHSILGSLRKNQEQAFDYVIPRGDWFEFVSSPHYLAEIVIYIGFLVASGGTDLTIWLFLGVVVINLVIGAAQTHKWYLRKFKNYPRGRYAIFPKVF